MSWLKTDTKLRGHPKLEPTANDLSISEVYLVGHLQYMWLGALERYEDGDLSNISDSMIASLAGWNVKKADAFVSVLTKHKWLENRVIHDWLDYAGDYLKRKYRRQPEKLIEIWNKHGKVYSNECTRTKPVHDACSTRTVHVHDAYSTSLELDIDKETTHTHTSASANFEASMSDSYQLVLSVFSEVTGRRSKDKATKEGAVIMAQAIDAGELEIEHLRHIIQKGMGDTNLKNQTLRGVANNFGNYLPGPDDKSSEALDAEMAECEERVAKVDDWRPKGLLERMSDEFT